MNATTFSKLEDWARTQWAEAALGDRRRTARAIRVGAALAAHPDASLPAQMQTWADLKAAYRLLNAPDVTHAALSTPHWRQTRAAAAGPEPVLFIQDTTEVDYTAHAHTTGLGHIGDGRGRGVELHSCLAVRAAEPPPAVLGLAYQQPWTRQEVHHGHETRTQRWARPRESAVWAQGLTAIGRPPAGATWISVSDSASDVFSFLREATGLGWHCLLRLCQDRAVRHADGTPVRLRRWVQTLPVQAEQTIELRGRDGVPKRTVVLQLAWAPVQLCAPRNGPERRGPPVAGWVLRCWGEELEWLLFTTLPIRDAATAQRYAQWYSWRWLIEDYHKALKTGCRLEARQLTTGQGLLALLGLVAVVAVRLLQLRMLSRQAPDTPASATVPPEVVAVLAGSLHVPPETLTVGQFWRGVARLGGFIGRASDGDPGWQTLWAGWHRLQDRVWGFHCAQVP
jgi:hypothetical protein